MPAGCEFFCDNEECKYFKSGFVITAPWPMANIGLIISSLKENDSFRSELIQLKNKGKKYACITFPNIKGIQSEMYRIQMWDDKDKCIWEYLIPYNEIQSVESIYTHSSVQSESIVKNPLKNFNEVVNDGILCPSCNQKLKQSRWFTNEQ